MGGEREKGGGGSAQEEGVRSLHGTLLTNYCKISESDTNIYLNLNVQVGQIG